MNRRGIVAALGALALIPVGIQNRLFGEADVSERTIFNARTSTPQVGASQKPRLNFVPLLLGPTGVYPYTVIPGVGPVGITPFTVVGLPPSAVAAAIRVTLTSAGFAVNNSFQIRSSNSAVPNDVFALFVANIATELLGNALVPVTPGPTNQLCYNVTVGGGVAWTLYVDLQGYFEPY